jgi:tetratricopeptide (TPR) repeat protein
MRNVKQRWIAIGFCVVVGGGLLLSGGCAATDPKANTRLDQANTQLRQAQYAQAFASANDAIMADPTGPTAAAAYYDRGRAIEDRPKADQTASFADLRRSAADYSRAVDVLGSNPNRTLEGQIRAQWGIVSIELDDYATAAMQLAKAVTLLDDDAARRDAMYGLGLSQQRLGLFDDADQTFARVEDQYPDSDVAKLSRSHAGTRAFYVSVGAFTSSDEVSRASAAIVQAGFTAQMAPQSNGVTIVLAGPFSKYVSAKALQGQLARSWPGSMIVP